MLFNQRLPMSSGRFTAIRTLRLSATGPRTIASIISSSVGGAGSSRRILKYYVQNDKMTASQFYQKFYARGIVL